ncbi:uncharacterized protein PGTG_21335 [Puccinia graminis f. sp. tritici CRL 75-36-700-3]|uniref:Uncharacterized protein n=1 Tax=Puccinia graminis f. sp. tritici (strain CRL 75-36-700-3 / race SCCL) TaxID=418459 RepID=H6QR21_PUCGT|nr:uncharacterized protein PGTG_21335 [Puccinia graminis f. sp. tritici CRL 75-36-700-3]EHS62965.1 hypothetical protein PGTG_21335 [Puccinia graminis f. sp. tritici CRL 75-36-700-3]
MSKTSSKQNVNRSGWLRVLWMLGVFQFVALRSKPLTRCKLVEHDDGSAPSPPPKLPKAELVELTCGTA